MSVEVKKQAVVSISIPELHGSLQPGGVVLEPPMQQHDLQTTSDSMLNFISDALAVDMSSNCIMTETTIDLITMPTSTGMCFIGRCKTPKHRELCAHTSLLHGELAVVHAELA